MTDLLDFLRGLLEDDDADASERVHVTVAGISGLDAHRSVIEAVLRQSEGAACFPDQFWSGSEGELENTLATAFKARIEGAASRELVLSESNGIVQASLGGATTDPTPGEREILGLATMLFSSVARRSSVVLFSYNEALIDGPLRGAVWRFFTEDLPQFGMRDVRHIVLIETNAADYKLHYPSGLGLTSFLGPSGLQRRKGWAASAPLIRNVANVWRDKSKDIVLFLGAGAAVSSGLPLGNQLRDEALRSLVGGHQPSAMIVDFWEYLREQGRHLTGEREAGFEAFAQMLTLERVMREELHNTRAEDSPTLNYFERENRIARGRPGVAITALRDLLRYRSGTGRTVVATVNFDTLVESTSEVTSVFGLDEFERVPERLASWQAETLPLLLKLHGTIDQRSTINASTENTSALAAEKALALRAVATDLRHPLWVYIGYSMRDLDVTDLLHLSEIGDATSEWWVSPLVDPSCAEFGRRRWPSDQARFGTRTIDVTADTFFSGLRDMVTEGG